MREGPIVCQISPLNLRAKVAGVTCLLEAMAIVRSRIPNIQLLIVGGGRMRTHVVRAAIRLDLGACTFFTDNLEDISLPLALTDLYCQITVKMPAR